MPERLCFCCPFTGLTRLLLKVARNRVHGELTFFFCFSASFLAFFSAALAALSIVFPRTSAVTSDRGQVNFFCSFVEISNRFKAQRAQNSRPQEINKSGVLPSHLHR